MSSVQAVIVAHNAGQLLERAVASLLMDMDEAAVVVVDNESTDGCADAVAVAYPQVRIVHADNRGFAAGNNRGIEATSADWLLLLNPDAELLPGALSALLSYGQEHEKAGIIGPEVLDTDGGRQADSRGRYPSVPELLRTKVSRVWHRLLGRRRPAPAALSAPTSVEWLTGACMLVRREALDGVGPMDEGFFLYYEDVDWCHRMHDAGWDVVVVPAAEVVHHLGRSDAPSALVAEKYRESFYRYCDKYGLRMLAALTRLGVGLRSSIGGRT